MFTKKKVEDIFNKKKSKENVDVGVSANGSCQ